METRCKNCQFWTTGPGMEDALRCPDGAGVCSSRQWRRAYGFDENTGEFEPQQVTVEDDEGWAFFTGPEFGCIHFSAKDTTA